MNQFPVPSSWQEFEQICLEFLREVWNRPELALYASRGQGQHGVDIVDPVHVDDLWVAQCKHVAAHLVLKPEDIRKEVGKALTYPQTIKKYALCTTSRKDRALEDEVMRINKEHAEKGLFTIELMYWEEMAAELEHRPILAKRLFKTSLAGVQSVLQEEMAPLKATVDKIATSAGSDAIDKQLALVTQLMEQFDFSSALAILKNLKTTVFDRMTGLQRFRCLTNIGTIEINSGNSAAISLFLDAYKEWPTHEKAVAHKAFAEFNLGDRKKAWSTLQEGVKNDPTNVNTAAAYILYAPETKDMGALLVSISETIRDHIRVVGAVAHRYLDQEEYEKAITWAKKMARDPKSQAEALYVEARATQLSAQPGDPRDELQRLNERRKMTEAVSLYDKAVPIFESQGARLMAIQAMLYQLDAAKYLDDMPLFARIAEGGLQLARTQKHTISEARFLQARSQMNTHKGDHEEALPDAEAAHSLSDALDIHLIYAYALWNRNHTGDREKARNELLGVFDKLTGSNLEEAADLVIRSFTREKNWSSAEEALLMAEGSGLDSARATLYRAEIIKSKGDLESAKEQALLSRDQLSASSSTSTRRLLGTLLDQLELSEDAANVIEPLASKEILSEDTRDFLNYLLKSGKDADFLKQAEDLRTAGVKDRVVLNAQVQLSMRYDPEKALQLIEEGIAWSPDAPWLRVWRSHLGVHLHRPELVTLTLKDVPSVDAVEFKHVYPTVEALVQNGLLNDAVEYAYRCLHRFPKESAVHAALIRSVLLSDDEKLDLPTPDEVIPGCVVEYIEDGSDMSNFVIIDDDVPDVFPGIIKSSSVIAKALLGHKKDDTIVLVSGVQDRVAKIKNIFNTYVYRMQQSLASWQLLFPDEPFVQQIRVKTSEETGQLDIEPMLKILTARAENTVRLDELYKAGAIPIGLLSHAMNRSIFDVMAHLAYEEGMFVNCAMVTDESHDSAFAKLCEAKGLVLDMTALWTLGNLGLSELLVKIPIPLIIAPEVLDALQEKIDALDVKKGKTSMAKDGEKIALIERTPDQIAEERNKWESITALVRKHCRVGTSLSLAQLPLKEREQLQKFTGQKGLTSVAAADDSGFLFWTDDRIQELIGKQFFKVDRVWTQVVLEWLQDLGKLPEQSYYRASAQLNAYNYSGTGVKAETVLEAGRFSNWDAHSLLLQKNLSILNDPAISQVNTLIIALNFLVTVSQEVDSHEKRQALVQQLLETLNKRPDGVSLIQGLMNRLPQTATFDPVGFKRMQDIIQAWLKAKLII